MKILVDSIPKLRHECLFARNEREYINRTIITTYCQFDEWHCCGKWDEKNGERRYCCPYLKVVK